MAHRRMGETPEHTVNIIITWLTLETLYCNTELYFIRKIANCHCHIIKNCIKARKRIVNYW